MNKSLSVLNNHPHIWRARDQRQSETKFSLGFPRLDKALNGGVASTEKLDMIAANDITAEGLGFNSDKNALHVIWQDGDKRLPATSKSELAGQLLALIAERYALNNKN